MRRPGPRTRVERKEAGRVDILRAAAHLLAERGYHGMSMRDLAETAHMNLANLYNYFASKEDLLLALQTRAFETLIAMADEVDAGARGPAERLHAFILGHVRYVAGHTDVMRVLVEEAGELPPRHRRAVRALKERYFRIGRERVRAVATTARPARSHAITDAAALERATYSLFGMLNWVYAWYAPRRHGSPRALARTIHRIAVGGLTARSLDAAALAPTERRVGRVAVRSPVRLHPAGEP